MNPISCLQRLRSTSRYLFHVIVLALIVSGVPVLGGQVVGAKQSTPSQYTLIELGSVKEYPHGQVYGINDAGVVVGVAFNPVVFTSRATIARNGKLRAMIKGETGISIAYDINDHGVVVGSSAASPFDPSVAMLWDGDEGTMLTKPNGEQAEAMEVNNDGLVVGYVNVNEETSEYQAFTWIDGTLTVLDSLPSATVTRAAAVNNRGEIVGSAVHKDKDSSALIEHAVVWRDGEITDLGVLNGENSRALGINDDSLIVGISTTVTGQSLSFDGTHAVLWENETATDLGVLETGSQSSATAINSEGQIVGFSTITRDGSSFYHATLWHNSDIYDLHDLVSNLPTGWTLESASNINDAGQIVGYATSEDGTYMSFLLTPEA